MAVSRAALDVWPTLDEVERAAAWLEEFGTAAAIPGDVTAKLQVVLDEILSNVIRHAASAAGPIRLEARRRKQDVELSVTDDGPPFDPTQFKPVSAAVRVAERQVGGAGLLFVRALMDEIDFAHRNGRNHLVLRKRLPPPTTER